ncbi:conserved hypothetical protein [Theileria orientalis strain Shintoku]|uniref:Uncharacterized protein n=1 Tax=Theileria orientalis strain Shintoku TaxID=869250 RepID=J7MEF7_THEOR|nr:conserved hypothetical protein [Theileria orientalis strain Shintoku]BAM38534.1 conserved hypothetical protein [Theileria orientalis strain Shintoku]|eukprot:XP_009688835.1 conserved hypothetical protein [Theileria orientalis strain Shintoku]
MKNIYTFVSYLLFRFFIQKTICLELNIGKIADYSSGSSQVTVKKTTELQNLYTHKFSNPVLLKDIYNGKERLYFDQLLVSDQLLLSASVVWSFETPSIIQLNLEQSSVLLINEKESLDVQAIFSKKLVTNIKPRIHSDIDAIVDINLSNIADYDSNNSKVYVTNLKFSEDRFKRYTLRNYNLESTRLGKILYNNTELTTKFENDVKRSTESNLDIPYKNNVYSIQVYAYNNFPLLIEFLYTFDKRQFYGYTPEEKWHHVYFPAFHDPSFLDFLYDKLNYYACKNGFKYTIDINQKTDTSDRSYQIDNYCIGSEGVETVVNNLKLASYINEINIERVHRCFEHTPSNDNKFFIDHLMYNSTVIQLKDTPKITKSVRVYQHLNHEPYLIVFVDYLDKLYHYKFQNGEWKNDDNLILLLDKTSRYEKSLVTSVLASATPLTLSQSNYEHQPNEVDVFLENFTPLESSGFKCYSQSIQPNGSSESLQLRVLVPTSAGEGKYTEISFYNDEKTKEEFIYYSKDFGKDNNNKLYIYYSSPGNQVDARPMLLCYGGKAYRPHSLDKYFQEWVRVSSISHCEALVSGSEVNKLLETLVQVSELLNPVNIKLSGQTAYTVHTFNGTPVQNVVSKTAGTSVTGCKFCYDKYVHTAKQGYRLGNVSYDASCIKFGTNERDAKCISATTAVNPYTTASEVVTYYFKDDADFSVPLLVAVKNDNSYRPYYILKSNTGPAKLYQKVDEQIDLANFEALGEKLNQIRHDFANTLQVIIGNRQGDGGSKTYRGKIYEVSGSQVQGGPTLPISLSDPVELPGEGEFKWFKYYEHRLDGETGINAIGGLRLFLRQPRSSNVIEIKLYSDSNGLTPINKIYYNTCKGNVQVYFSEDTDERPLLVCYGGKAYRPLNKESYTTKWVPVDTITKCPCETGQNSTLLEELRKTLLMLNVIETYIIPKATIEHSTCKLFKFYRNQLMYDKIGDIQVCKDAQCSNKVILREGDHKNYMVYSQYLYFNKYDMTFTHPIMLVLYCEEKNRQDHTKYYRFSEFESDKTNTSAKTTFGLPAYPSEKEFLSLMIADNDAVLGSITYQIDHKDNTYNSSKVNVENTTNNSNKIKSSGFMRYKHTPKGGTIKKSYILHKLNILTQWNTSNKKAVSIDNVQGIMIKQIDVFFSPESDEVLLVGFFHNNKVDYFYQKLYEKTAIHWEPINENAINAFLGKNINKANIHTHLTNNDNEVMVQLLNKLKETAEQTYYKFGLASSPNAINTYQKPTSGEEYPPCKLMLKYEFTPASQQSGKNITVLKAGNEKLTLKPDGEYAKMVYSRSEVYYNKYDETNTPLLIVLYFIGGTKYYKMSGFTTDKAQGKNISAMDNYTDAQTVLTPLLEENDSLSSLITYRIDQKIDSTAQNNYNGGKISLAEESVQELKQKGFSKYTHRPTANNNSKKACVIYNGDVLLSQDESGAMVVITGLQNIVYNSLSVYHSNRVMLPLLVQFTKQNNSVEYYYHKKKNGELYWQLLDQNEYSSLLGQSIVNDQINSKLTSDKSVLVKLLQKIEFLALNTIVLLTEKHDAYDNNTVYEAIKKTNPELIPNPQLTNIPTNPIAVTKKESNKLEELGFNMYQHEVRFGQEGGSLKEKDKIELRFLIPTGPTATPSYTEISLYKTSSDTTSPQNRDYLFCAKIETEDSSTAVVTKYYTYSYGDDPSPLLLCHENKAYRPLNKDTELTKWVKVDSIESCKIDQTNHNQQLLDVLLSELKCSNVVNWSKYPTQSQIDYSSNLFVPYVYQHTIPKPCDVNVCKEENCNTKLVLQNDTSDKNSSINKEEVYYNRYHTSHNKPLLVSINFKNNSIAKRYYRLSRFDTDISSGKNIKDLETYTDEKTIFDHMIADNDTAHDTVTYQLDKKDDNYNSRVQVAHSTNPVQGFTKYTHTPKNAANKTSFVIYNSNILTYWNSSANKAGAINDFQNKILNTVNVYFSNKVGVPLLAAFELKDNANGASRWEYYYQIKKEMGMFWQVLDYTSSRELINVSFSKEQAHSKLADKNNELLINLLRNLESKAVYTAIALIDKQAQYNKSDVDSALRILLPQIPDLSKTTSAQPQNIPVNAVDIPILTASNFKCVSQTISATGTDQIKFLIPSINVTLKGQGQNYTVTNTPKYIEANFYNSSGNIKIKTTYKNGYNHLYVYYYGLDPRPLMLCYENKVYKPLRTGDPERNNQVKIDYAKWVEVEGFTSCVNTGTGSSDSNTQKLLDNLISIAGYLNPVQLCLDTVPKNARSEISSNKENASAIYSIHDYVVEKTITIKITKTTVKSYKRHTYEHNGLQGANDSNGFTLGDVIFKSAHGGYNAYKINYVTTTQEPAKKMRHLVKVTGYFHMFDSDFQDPLLVILEFKDGTAGTANTNEYYKLTVRSNEVPGTMQWDKDDTVATIMGDQSQLLEFLNNVRYNLKYSAKIQLHFTRPSYPFSAINHQGTTEYTTLSGTQTSVTVSKESCPGFENSSFKCYKQAISSVQTSHLYYVTALKMSLPRRDQKDAVIQLFDETGQTPINKLVYDYAYGDLYVYYYRNYNYPLMFCLHGSAFKPHDKNSYVSKWVKVKEIQKCDCKTLTQDETKQLVTTLTSVAQFTGIYTENDIQRAKNILDLSVDDEAMKYITDPFRIIVMDNVPYPIDTFKKDRETEKHRTLNKIEFDTDYHRSYYHMKWDYARNAKDNVFYAQTNPGYAFNRLKHHRYDLYTFPTGVYPHRIEWYKRESNKSDIVILVFTNTLFVYKFRIVYTSRQWKHDTLKYCLSRYDYFFVGVEPVVPNNRQEEYSRYCERVKFINKLDFDSSMPTRPKTSKEALRYLHE